MKKITCFLFIFFMAFKLFAGPYAPAAGKKGSKAIALDNKSIIAWAAYVEAYKPGESLEERWKRAERALGAASAKFDDVVSLGIGGSITLGFNPPIKDNEGYDFAVFSNSFSDTFLELAFVELSSDGVNFLRFPNHCLIKKPVHAFGNSDPSDLYGFAGKYRAGFGTPFDISELEEQNSDGLLDLNSISFIRLVDVTGDGSTKDSYANPVYAPYPTFSSAGFDLDGIAVLSGFTFKEEEEGEEERRVSSSLDEDFACFLNSLINF